MNRIRLVCVLLAILMFQACDYCKPHNLIAQHLDQKTLRYLASQNLHLKLHEDARIDEAYSDGGRDATLWFKVKFDTARRTQIIDELAKNGFKAEENDSEDVPRGMPQEVKTWWLKDAHNPTKLFVLELDKRGSGGEGAWCYVDSVNGVVYGCSYSN